MMARAKLEVILGCHHSAPWDYAPLIIRWGEQASSA